MDLKRPQEEKYLREVQELTAVWHKQLNTQERLHRQEANDNVFHFIQDGLYGIEERWKAEAERRRAAIPRIQEGTPFEKEFFAFANAVYQHQVALQMSDVVRLAIYKTEEGFDKRWLGLVEGVDGEGVCDDYSNRNVALGFFINEEVKLRRGEAFSPLYFWLKSNNEQEMAQLHLNAFVRSQLALSHGHDLLEAVKCSEASADPGIALLLELRSELASTGPLLDLRPKALKLLPGQAAYGIRKRLLPIASSTSDALERPAARLVTAFYNSERISEAKQNAKPDLRRWLTDSGLTPDQYQVYCLNKIEGMTLADIALRLGKAPGTVASHKARARVKIEAFKKKSSK